MNDEPKKFTQSNMEAALCVWEYLLDCRNNYAEDCPELMAYWIDNDAWEMRHWAIKLAPWVDEVWSTFTEDDRDMLLFDWEWVPLIMSFVDWTKNGPEKPSTEEVIDHINAHLVERKMRDSMNMN